MEEKLRDGGDGIREEREPARRGRRKYVEGGEEGRSRKGGGKVARE
jgi:hypothetical protein